MRALQILIGVLVVVVLVGFGVTYPELLKIEAGQLRNELTLVKLHVTAQHNMVRQMRQDMERKYGEGCVMATSVKVREECKELKALEALTFKAVLANIQGTDKP